MIKTTPPGIARTLTFLTGISMAASIHGAEILNEDFNSASNSAFADIGWFAYFTKNDSSVVDWSNEPAVSPGWAHAGDYIFFAPGGTSDFDVVNGPAVMFTSLESPHDISTIASIEVGERMDGTPEDPALARILIEVDNQWYASDFSFESTANVGPTGDYNPVTLDGIDFADGSNWRLATLAVGEAGTGGITVAASPIGGTLSGNLQAVGVYSEPGGGGDHSRFGSYIVNDNNAGPPPPPAPIYVEEFTNEGGDTNFEAFGWTSLLTEFDTIVSYAQTGVGSAAGVSSGDYAFFAPKQDADVANAPALITTSEPGPISIETLHSIAWEASADNTDDEFRVAIQVGGVWYASNPALNDGQIDSGAAGMTPLSFEPASFSNASNWLTIDNATVGATAPISLGSAPAGNLSGAVTAFGLYLAAGTDDEADGDHVRFDNFTITTQEIVDTPTLKIESDGTDLVFRWDSEDGKLYNLRSATTLSDPTSEWPIYDGHGDIVATSPTNTLRVAQPANPTRFFVIEEFDAPPVTVFSDDLESGSSNWSTSSIGNSGTDWQLGTPTEVGPSSANSGSNCFGTNISGDYGSNADVSLRSTLIDLSSARGATLSFSYYLEGDPNPDGAPFDTATLNILDSNDDVLAVVEVLGNETTSDWTSYSKALPANVLGQPVKIEFRFVSDGIMNAPGWYLDDVAVSVP
ncbi:hypothetical protein ACFQY0_02145 [Haloferula chungangensis]|uniref:MAM domain-containing protein n=1 Tax=Haloferula chungangensis TaxID=1048331 RepID=A0ABW2L317_9BACT